MAKFTLTVSVDNLSATDLANLIPVDKKANPAVNGAVNLISAVASGARQGYIEVETGVAYSSFTLTCAQASAVATTDEFTIGSMTFSSVASGADATAGEWELGASNAAMATNIAAAINGITENAGIMTATASGAVVTVTLNVPGAAGDEIALTETGNGITLSGSYPTGGTGGNVTKFSRGV